MRVSAEKYIEDRAWLAASKALNPNSADYPAAEDKFREGYGFAQHNGGYHFEGERGEGKDLYDRVLTIHDMWIRDTNTPDSAARVLGMLAALNVQMNQPQGGNA